MRAEDVAQRLKDEGLATHVAAGWARRRGDGSYARGLGGDVATFFDLASVTKSFFATAVAASGLSRSATLGELLPELAGARAADAPLDLLLAHRAGLDAHRPLFLPLVFGQPFLPDEALREAADALRPELVREVRPAHGFPPVYSDLGYLLAGAAVARATGRRDAGEVIASGVLRPVGLERSVGTAEALEKQGIELASACAPTEDVPWRGGVLRGVVHDENAWAFTGRGGSGHAGLFGTAPAVLTFGCAVLDAFAHGCEPFGPGVDVAWLVEPRPGGTLRAGFDGKSQTGYTSAGTRVGPRAFGHLGFTGTSLWIDPDLGIVMTLLTNRVFPRRDRDAIRTARPWAHDALVAAATAA